MWHTAWRPVTLGRWLQAPADRKPRGNVGIGRAWRLTREILKHHTSHSWAALAGWSYIPTGMETAIWDQYELEGRLKRHGWRPWAASRDPFAPTRVEPDDARRARLERRERLKRRYHIDD